MSTYQIFQRIGNSEIEKVRWAEVDQRVWINATQYFAPIPREVWEFRVGGHCPAKKMAYRPKIKNLDF